jgi:hypothetical protein
MLLNNSKKGLVFVYQIQFSEGKWYAWYNDTTETSIQNLAESESQNQSLKEDSNEQG